jgi:tetratricopeptide (TPR) repeat protein
MNLRVVLLASLAVSLMLSCVLTTSSALSADAVDKSLVGIWEARFTAQGGTGICRKTWTIKPDGDSGIIDVPEYGHDGFGVAGKVAFSDGRCVFTFPDGRKESAAYNLVNPNHLIVDSVFGSAVWRRVNDADGTVPSAQHETARVHNNTGVTLSQIGNWDESIKEHEAALMAEPTSQAFRTNLSSAHLQYGYKAFKNGDYRLSEEQYRKAMFVDPLNADASDGLQQSLEKLKNAGSR